MSRILLVEDEDHLAEGLAFNLRNFGYDVDIVTNGEEALEVLESSIYDLILLDVMLPGIDGLQVARELRRSGHLSPILMMTAKNRTEDVVAGLDAGADDYITKPFDLDVLLARIRGTLRRQVWGRKEPRPDLMQDFSFGGWSVDFESFVARNEDGREFKLTVKELAILRLFASRPGAVISRETFLEEAWGVSGDIETRTVDNFMRKLRQRFEPDPSNPRYIVSVRGVGYQFREDA